MIKTIQPIVTAALEKKAENVVCLDLTKIQNRVTDYMIICSSLNSKQGVAIADNVQQNLFKRNSITPRSKEGFSGEYSWLLLDYVDIFIHIFNKEKRYFYDLENLWGDALINAYN